MSALKTKFIWDYDTSQISLRRPDNVKWLFERQLRFGDLTDIKAKQLKKVLPQLDINLSLRELLTNFLNQHADKI